MNLTGFIFVFSNVIVARFSSGAVEVQDLKFNRIEFEYALKDHASHRNLKIGPMKFAKGSACIPINLQGEEVTRVAFLASIFSKLDVAVVSSNFKRSHFLAILCETYMSENFMDRSFSYAPNNHAKTDVLEIFLSDSVKKALGCFGRMASSKQLLAA